MDKLPFEGAIETETAGLGASRRVDSAGVVKESTFMEIPVGSQIRAKSVSFSKLQSGDFALISSNQGCLLRRFLSVAVENGNTRLVMVDGQGRQESMPFVRLLARVEGVSHQGKWVNPNPSNLFQRAGFRMSCWFHRDNSAA